MSAKVWTDLMEDKLRELWPTHSARECGKILSMSHTAVKTRASKLKLQKVTGYNRMANSIRALTAEEVKFIQENYLKYTNHDLARLMNRSESAIQRCRKILGIEGKPNEGCFKKGNISFNKGKKQSEYMSAESIERSKATRFQKGITPHNTKTDGLITVRHNKKRPYQYIRISKAKWKELHLVVWERHYGKVPKGFNVQFKDKNTMNCTIENLYLIDRQHQMVENSIQRYPAEIRTTMQSLGKFKSKIKKYEEQN